MPSLWRWLMAGGVGHPLSCAQTPHPEQLGPHVGSSETLDLISSKDLASHLTDYDWNLFKSIHQARAAPGAGRDIIES